MQQQPIFDIRNFPKAQELIDTILKGQQRVIGYGGAVRGGKSYNMIGGAVLFHKLFPMSRSVIIREDFERLKKNTFPTCEKVIPKNFVRKFNAGSFEWIFKNGSSMRFMGENYPQDPQQDRFNGLEFNLAILDQCEELQRVTFDKVLERAGSYFVPKGFKQPPSLVMFTVNPTDTWVRELVYEKWKANKLPDKWKFIEAKITDNPHVPKEYMESLLELKKINPVKYERFVNGDWDVREKVGTEFYDKFNRSIHVKKLKYDNTLPVHLSFDFNVVPYMTMLACQIDISNCKTTFRFFKEYCSKSPDNSSRAVSLKFIKDFGMYKPLVFFYGDSTGKNRIAGQGNQRNFDDIEAVLISFLSTASDRVVKNPNQFKARDFINLILAGFWSDIAIEIDESCTELIADMENVKLGIEGKVKQRINDKALGISYEKYGHTSDALTYCVVSVLYELYNATSHIG